MTEHSEDYALQAVLDEFGFGDGVVNASDVDAAAMAAEVVRLRSAEIESVIHFAPPPGQGMTPCCDRTPFELPVWDRLTTSPEGGER